MNFFTPELGPPMQVPHNAPPELKDWIARVTGFLNGMREELDTKMEAFIQSTAQMGVGVGVGSIEPSTITLTHLNTMSFVSTTVSLAVSAVTQVSIVGFSMGPGTIKRPMVMPICTAAGWFVSVAGAATNDITLNCYNRSASTATVTVYAFYLA